VYVIGVAFVEQVQVLVTSKVTLLAPALLVSRFALVPLAPVTLPAHA
jgi:hypothetical protein